MDDPKKTIESLSEIIESLENDIQSNKVIGSHCLISRLPVIPWLSNASVIQTESVKTQIPWYWSTTSSETNFNVFPKSLQRKWDQVVIFIDRLKSAN